jgi:hypothetical protein
VRNKKYRDGKTKDDFKKGTRQHLLKLKNHKNKIHKNHKKKEHLLKLSGTKKSWKNRDTWFKKKEKNKNKNRMKSLKREICKRKVDRKKEK